MELFEDTKPIGDAKFAIGVANGLDAIFLALLVIMCKGDEVIVPANTYIGTWLAVSRTGASIKPVPAHENTYNLNEELLSRDHKKDKSDHPGHLYGQPANLDPILDLARRKNIFVIEDAAQAHGAKYKFYNRVVKTQLLGAFIPAKILELLVMLARLLQIFRSLQLISVSSGIMDRLKKISTKCWDTTVA